MEILRYCLMNQHKDQVISHLCLFDDCKVLTRWACQLCLENEIHKHKQFNNDHLMDRQQLIQLLSQQDINLDHLITQIKQDVFTLTRQQIIRMINFHNRSSEIPQKNKKGGQNRKQIQSYDQPTSFESIQRENYNYTIFFEQQITEKGISFRSSLISPNEELVLFSLNKYLLLFDLKSHQKLFQKQMMYEIIICLFSEDSNYLFCGDSNSVLFCYKVNKDFKLLYHKKLQIFSFDLIFINPQQILAKYRSELKILNTKINKWCQKTNISDTLLICSLDIYSKQQIVLYVWISEESEDYYIQFFKIPNFSIIIKQKFMEAIQLQMINDIQFISISCFDDDRLSFWQINYNTKQVQLMKTFQSQQSIRSFTYYQNIIFLYNKEIIQIITTDLNIVKIIQHDVGHNDMNRRRQFKSLNFVLISGGKKLKIFKLQPNI